MVDNIRLEKVNVYMTPMIGGGETSLRLTIDRGFLTISFDHGVGVIKVFERTTQNQALILPISSIFEKKKNIVCQQGNTMFSKGQTELKMKRPIMVSTFSSTSVIFRMDLEDHRRFNQALDSFSA